MLESPRDDHDDLPLDLRGLEDDPDVDDCIPLDDDKEQVGYELFDWDATDLDLLDDELHQHGLPHEWLQEGFELVVHADDEAAVDAMLPSIRFPDELPAMDDDDDAGGGSEILSRLYDAADRIARDARGDGVGLLLDLAERMPAEPPFGIAPKGWDDMVEAVDHIIDGLVADAPVERIQDAADELRTRLRPLV